MTKNDGMTPMERIDLELLRKRMTWEPLKEVLEASKQSVTNWRSKGLPKKHYSKVDDFFGKPYGWTELGVESQQDMLDNNPERLQTILSTIAAMFRMIPEAEWGDALLDVSSTLQKRGHFR